MLPKWECMAQEEGCDAMSRVMADSGGRVGWREKLCTWPPWPLSNLYNYLGRLSSAFGWRYVASVILCYGINQGIGESLVYYARRYYVLDDAGLSSYLMTQLFAFAGLPWVVKSLFGVLSDTIPINGLHRAPYMFFAGLVGVFATSYITFAPAITSPFFVALVLMSCNLNFAMPDVMIDASVAERSKLRPDLAAELQALCWGSINSIGIIAGISKGYLYQLGAPKLVALLQGLCSNSITSVDPADIADGLKRKIGGTRLIFAVCIVAAACVLIPPTFGWIERRPPNLQRERCVSAVRRLCGQTWGEKNKRSIVGAALIVVVFSVSMFSFNLLPFVQGWSGLTPFNLVADIGLCISLYFMLRRVDKCLAGAAVYTFLSNALAPYSGNVIFDWYHDPSGSDTRCLCPRACAALLNGTAAPSSPPSLPPPPFLPPGAAAPPSQPTSVSTGLPCGWAYDRNYPCIDPLFYSWVTVAEKFVLTLGVWFYVSFMQHWTFRKVFTTTQLFMCVASFADFMWVTRANLSIGISDRAFLLFGSDIFYAFAYKLNQMPFLIYAAKLCPDGVEATMFSLFMGLSNFGANAAENLGAGLQGLFGGIEAPAYENISGFVALSCAMKALPVLLVPFLVPLGTPLDTAKEMGAGKGVTDPAGTGDGIVVGTPFNAEVEMSNGGEAAVLGDDSLPVIEDEEGSKLFEARKV